MHEMSTTHTTPLTPVGKQRIEHELERLITVRRAEVSEDIRQSRQIGDVSENAEYAIAKAEQALVEQRIAELRSVLAVATVLEKSEIPDGFAGIGSVVTLRDQELDEEWEVTLVSSYEADPEESQISVECPLGEALLGKQVGDLVIARVPDGNVQYQVVSIRSLLN
jgi:transcription elongation factor GreA